MLVEKLTSVPFCSFNTRHNMGSGSSQTKSNVKDCNHEPLHFVSLNFGHSAFDSPNNFIKKKPVSTLREEGYTGGGLGLMVRNLAIVYNW